MKGTEWIPIPNKEGFFYTQGDSSVQQFTQGRYIKNPALTLKSFGIDPNNRFLTNPLTISSKDKKKLSDLKKEADIYCAYMGDIINISNSQKDKKKAYKKLMETFKSIRAQENILYHSNNKLIIDEIQKIHKDIEDKIEQISIKFNKDLEALEGSISSKKEEIVLPTSDTYKSDLELYKSQIKMAKKRVDTPIVTNHNEDIAKRIWSVSKNSITKAQFEDIEKNDPTGFAYIRWHLNRIDESSTHKDYIKAYVAQHYGKSSKLPSDFERFVQKNQGKFPNVVLNIEGTQVTVDTKSAINNSKKTKTQTKKAKVNTASASGAGTN